MRPLILKDRTEQHAGGKEVAISRDYSMQAAIVKAALRRKRKNDVRNSKAVTDVSVHSVDSNVAEPVLPTEGVSEGPARTRVCSESGNVFDEFSYAEDGIKTAFACAEGRTVRKSSAVGPSERFPGAVTRRISAANSNLQNISPKLTEEQCSEVERIRVGLRESDGVGRGQEPVLRGEGGDSSLSDQPS